MNDLAKRREAKEARRQELAAQRLQILQEANEQTRRKREIQAAKKAKKRGNHLKRGNPFATPPDLATWHADVLATPQP